MYTLGIVGGVASGKSRVAAEFALRSGKAPRSRITPSAALLDADLVGHEVLRDPEVVAAAQQRWGEGVVDAEGQVVRREVAKRVFGDDPAAIAERAFLNSVTHPRIRDRLRTQLSELRIQQAPLAVIDAALLYETTWSQLCDGVVFVHAPRDVRLQRAAQRGWSPEQFAAREASQWPVEEKRVRARWVVNNGGTVEEIAPQVEQIMLEIERDP